MGLGLLPLMTGCVLTGLPYKESCARTMAVHKTWGKLDPSQLSVYSQSFLFHKIPGLH